MQEEQSFLTKYLVILAKRFCYFNSQSHTRHTPRLFSEATDNERKNYESDSKGRILQVKDISLNRIIVSTFKPTPMTRDYYSLLRHRILLPFVLLSSFLIASQLAYGQSTFDPGIVRIKVSEQMAQYLESVQMTRDADDVIHTGIQSIDANNVKYKVRSLTRVFRPAGKFEARHRRHGLHLWYELRMDETAPVLEALSAYGSIDDIQVAEPSYKKRIIGSDNPSFGPYRVAERKSAPDGPLAGPANDPMLGDQWHYNNTGQVDGTPGSDISLFQAWSIETGSPDVIIGVTDGGAQVNHPDLAANMWINEDEIPGNGIDDDNNGFVDDIHGYGFGDNSPTIAPDDHGTHVSGTIAAVTNNGLGVAGVAGGTGSGDGARIMSLAAFGAFDIGGFAESYVYAADNGAVISQNSWGYTLPNVFEQVVLDGIDYFIAEAGKDENGVQVGPMNGGIVIFAAGNDDSDANWYPGFYEPTLAVSGVTNQDKKAWYSNYGTWVDIAAPGGETFFTNDPHGVLSTVTGGQYAFFQGTSMACPHVSGTAALIISKFGGPGFTPEMLRGRLTQLVDDIDAADPPFAGLLGSGRLNAFKALQENDGNAPDPISDLAAADVGITHVTLTWTSPVDSANGSASVYDLRYAQFPITEANFSTATQAPDVPAPSPAGSTETFMVSGLSGGETYYFAIKSADFFGNFSTISNVVEQNTNFAPNGSIEEDTLVANLLTAQATNVFVNIINDGQGPLTFSFSDNGPGEFATPSIPGGIVPADSSLLVSIHVDAAGLFAGTYTQHFNILTNDPDFPSILLVIHLNVMNNDAPIASVDPTELDFGPVFVGDSVTQVVTLHNAGSDSLHILSLTADQLEYFPSTATMVVEPFGDATISVTFAPSALGVVSSTLSISTDDPVNPVLQVSLTGEGVPAPDIQVDPTSLSSSLNTGRSETQQLTLTNAGGSDLEFTIEVESVSQNAVAPTPTTLTILPGQMQSHAPVKAQPTGSFPNEVSLRSVTRLAAEAQVLILTPDANVTDIETILDGFDDIEADVFPAALLPSITLADLLPYDIVFTTNNTQWLGSGGVDPGVIGDLLADYIDAGGKVISNQFTYSYDAWRMEGRFVDENYGPFTPSTTDAVVTVGLGTILAPEHPVFENVTTLNYSGFVQNVGLAPGGTAIARWSNGEYFIAANENVVALNMLPSLGNGGALQWTGDLPLIYHNAVRYLAGPGFVSVTPLEGTVAAGTSIDLEVFFDATGLDSAIYEANIRIVTNVPAQPVVDVAATLHVLGPEFTVNPTSLSEELEKDQTSTQIIVLNNNGPDDQPFTVSVEAVGIGVSAMPMGVQPMMAAFSSTARTTSSPPAIDRQAPPALATPTVVGDGREPAGTMMRTSMFNPKSGPGVAQQSSTDQYATDFDDLVVGDIDGQDGWIGLFGNWTVQQENAYSESQHFRGLSDGLGLSLAFTPVVPIGTNEKSTVTAKVALTGAGVTWQIIPQSLTTGLVVTRIQFNPDGTISALIPDGVGGAIFDEIGTAPAGYFDLTIESDRDSAYFNVLINGQEIYTATGFAGDVEQVAILSQMEISGPTMDIDDLRIIDGEKEGASFVNVSPASGIIPAGTSLALAVTFDSHDLAFGMYHANIDINVGETHLVVPASLRVFGDPQIDVDPTVLIETVDFRESTTRNITVTNTGGNPLEFSMTVIGADTDQSNLLVVEKSQQSSRTFDRETLAKLAEDEAGSRPVQKKASTLQLLTGTPILSEDFEGGTFPPTGWTVIDNAGTGVVWDFAAAWGDGNYCGTGEAATVNSDAAGRMDFDTELITPAISTAGFKDIAVQYNANYINFLNADFLDVDISVDGGPWTNVLQWNEDHGDFFGPTGESVTLQLGSYIGNGSSFRLRWHYYDPGTNEWDWYAQIDDVVVYGDPRAWLVVNPASGTVPVNGSLNVEALFDAEDIDAGTYVAGVLVNSNATEDPLVGIVAQLTVRQPAVITVTPESVHQELLKGQIDQASQTLTITNSGQSALKFGINNTPIPASSGLLPENNAPLEGLEGRMAPSQQRLDPTDPKALIPDGPITFSVPVLSTGFEEFAAGNINGQNGWVGQFGLWTIEAVNPFEGMQHMRAISDGFGDAAAFSPTIPTGVEPVSSATFVVDPDPGVTWQIITQSPTEGFVNTRIQFNPDGSLSALVQDSLGNAFFEPVNVTLPEGYFDVRIDVERATSQFTLFVNDEDVFTGQGFSGNIEQIVFFSAMETGGPNWYIDNVVVYDGTASEPWLTVDPKSGIVPSGGSETITLTFNSTDLDPGTYYDTLTIANNDPVSPIVNVPITLDVIFNHPPELALIDTTYVIELSSANVTFTATDVDDEPVMVTLLDFPSFISLTSTGDGTATYHIAPQLGDAGTYNLMVTAMDNRGKGDTTFFNLIVVPYGVESFTLFNWKTGQEYGNFADTILVDISIPDLKKLSARANTNPATVGSVKFELDNKKVNIDDKSPYELSTNSLKKALDGDDHILVARAYTQTKGKGSEGQALTAVVRLVNPAVVTDFDIMSATGAFLGDLHDGMVIDHTQPAWQWINIRANTEGGIVKSVVFRLNGHLFRVDNLAPYYLGGIGSLIDFPLPALPGDYELTATPYSEHYGQGIAGNALTVYFSIGNDRETTTARRIGGEQGVEGELELQTNGEVSIYPVPATDVLNLELVERSEAYITLALKNSQGQTVYADEGQAGKFSHYTIDLSRLGLSNGVYFVQLQYSDGRQSVKKVIVR